MTLMDADQLKNSANTIIGLAEQAKKYKDSKKLFLERMNALNEDYSAKKITKEELDKKLKDLLKGKTRKQEIDAYDQRISELLEQIKNQTGYIKQTLSTAKKQGMESALAKILSSGEKYEHMPAKQKKKYLRELNLDPEIVKKFLTRKKRGELEATERDYVAYETHTYGRISNQYAGKLTRSILKNKGLEPYVQKLFHDLRFAGFKILSKTYLSMMIFSAIIAAIVAALLASILFTHPSIPLQIIRGILIGTVAGISTGAFIYFYPSSVASSKQSAMQSEIPFMLIHMSAVAGSGAKPIAMFQTLLLSKDYPALGPDIKKIVNYVNVFGYDLSTALRLVAETTASSHLKEILNGMINTISSGGDMKHFLESVSQDALTSYQLERKKAVEAIATYSDIYTVVLIAAPLLFFVTIAIIQMLGGTIAGLSVDVIATIGTYGVIPLLNIGFIIFISMVQPK